MFEYRQPTAGNRNGKRTGIGLSSIKRAQLTLICIFFTSLIDGVTLSQSSLKHLWFAELRERVRTQRATYIRKTGEKITWKQLNDLREGSTLEQQIINTWKSLGENEVVTETQIN